MRRAINLKVLLIVLAAVMVSSFSYAGQESTDKQAEELFKEARKEQKYKNWDKALMKLRKVIAKRPNHPVAHKARIEIGKHHKYHRDWQKAIAKYREVVALAPHSREAHDAVTAEAAIYYFRQDFDRALKLFEEIYEETEDWDQIKYCSYWIKATKRKLGIPLEQRFSCGKKSVQIALGQLGIELDEEGINNLFKNKSTMLSLLELKKAVEKKQVTPQVVKVSSGNLEYLDTPFIALVAPEHYVVVDEVTQGEVVYIDPLNEDTSIRETLDAFGEHFQGYALVFMKDSLYAKANAVNNNGELAQVKGGACACCRPHGLGDECSNKGTEFSGSPVKGSGGGGCVGMCSFGEPRVTVHPMSLNMVAQATDLSYSVKGMPVRLRRVYNSDSPNETVFGRSWTFNYNVKLLENPDQSIDITRGDDKVDHFFWNGVEYQGPLGVHDTLINNTDGSYNLILKGSKTSYNFNDTGVLQNITDRNNNTISFSYNGDGNLLQITDPNNQYVNFTYGNNSKVSRVTLPDGRYAEYIYDMDDNLIQTTNLGNSTISYAYNDNSYMTGIDSPSQGSFSINYVNQNGYHVHSIIDEESNGWIYTSYTSSETKIEDSRGGIIINRMDTDGFTESITTSTGNKIEYAYDSSGNRNETTDVFGKTIYITYDGNGNPIQITDPLGKTVNLTWDSTNDTLSNITDPKGNVYSFTYDGEGNLLTVTDPDNEITEFDYNSYGQLLNLTDANNGVTSFTYDAGGNLTRMNDPLGEVTNYTYDTMGRLTGLTDPNGNTFSYTYDGVGYLTNVTYPNASMANYTYSCCNLIEAQDASGSLYFSYNGMGRLVSFTNQDNHTIAYEYDSEGNLVNLTYPGNKTVNYEYDADNRLTKVTDWLEHETLYNYDKGGRLTSSTSPGLITIYKYDNAGKLITLMNYNSNTMEVVSAYTYEHDDNSNRENVSRYLPLGNASFSTTNAAYSYNADNQLTSDGVNSYSYDNNGNLESISGSPAMNFTYNVLNQLVEYSDGSQVYNYSYDALGNRIAKEVNTTTTKYVVNPAAGLPSVIAETDVNGTITAYYVYGLGLISKIDASGEDAYYYQYDGLGSTVAITDENGTIVNKYAYGDFGEEAENRVEGVSNPFRYVGRYGVQTDADDLLYMRARYYKPSVGRFINKDPIGLAGGMNLYNYVGGNPIGRIDPMGLWSIQIGFSGSGGGGAGGTTGAGIVIGYSDEQGPQWGVYGYGGGGSHVGLGGSVGIDIIWSRNDDICNDLSGDALTVGGSISLVGIVIGGEINTPISRDASSSYTVSVGLGGGAVPAEGHGYYTVTQVYR